MSETDPGPGRDMSEAGVTGARRQEIGTPIPSDERGSLNIPPNEPETRPGAGSGRGASTGDLGLPPWEGGTPQSFGSDAGAVRGPQSPEEAVRREIEETRRELGDSVEALMHKTDVKGRVQEKAAHMGDDLKRMGAATAGTATGLVDRVKGAAPEMLDKAKQATPAEVRHAAERVSTEAGRRPAATLAVLGAVALVVVRVLRNRRSSPSGTGKAKLVTGGAVAAGVSKLMRSKSPATRMPRITKGGTSATRMPRLITSSPTGTGMPRLRKHNPTGLGRLKFRQSRPFGAGFLSSGKGKPVDIGILRFQRSKPAGTGILRFGKKEPAGGALARLRGKSR
ncbi:DUF3618 domain-containing protein [Planomonospora corallina]|uniref:DUF3618 domain-containing protein n=1 Tax=Planomonospora corallina TaxID=1806052 RepID=A0ABV8I1L7_9ACTN